MWNRAHLKVMRIAALLAVADHHIAPTIHIIHAEWAISLIRHDIAVFSKRLRDGEIGEGTDDGRERKLLDLIREYLLAAEADVPSYAKPWNEMRQQALVPRKYLQIRTQRLAAFEKHPRGHRFALDTAIQTAIDNGQLFQTDKARTAETYGFGGKVYGVPRMRQDPFNGALKAWVKRQN